MGGGRLYSLVRIRGSRCRVGHSVFRRDPLSGAILSFMDDGAFLTISLPRLDRSGCLFLMLLSQGRFSPPRLSTRKRSNSFPEMALPLWRGMLVLMTDLMAGVSFSHLAATFRVFFPLWRRSKGPGGHPSSSRSEVKLRDRPFRSSLGFSLRSSSAIVLLPYSRGLSTSRFLPEAAT